LNGVNDDMSFLYDITLMDWMDERMIVGRKKNGLMCSMMMLARLIARQRMTEGDW